MRYGQRKLVFLADETRTDEFYLATLDLKIFREIVLILVFEPANSGLPGQTLKLVLIRIEGITKHGGRDLNLSSYTASGRPASYPSMLNPMSF